MLLSVSLLSLLQEVITMAKIYYKRIINPNDSFTFDDVPNRWKGAVKELLEKDAH